MDLGLNFTGPLMEYEALKKELQSNDAGSGDIYMRRGMQRFFANTEEPIG
jgi:hypothetical protein